MEMKVNLSRPDITEAEIDRYFQAGIVDLNSLELGSDVKDELYKLAYKMIHRET